MGGARLNLNMTMWVEKGLLGDERCMFLKKMFCAWARDPSLGAHLERLGSFKSDFISPIFKQSHWYSCQHICSVNHKHFRDSIGLYLEIQTPAHKSHLCKCFTRAQCVFYVFFMSVERPHLEWHSLPEPLGEKIQKPFTGSFSITYALFPLRMSLCKNTGEHVSSCLCSPLLLSYSIAGFVIYLYPGCGDLLVR